MRKRFKKQSQIKSTTTRMRLSVFRSRSFIYAQVIDDIQGVTIVADSSLKAGNGSNVLAAQEVGRRVAEKAIAAGVKSVVFDRGAKSYSGRIKALADAARESGLDF